MQSLLLSIGIFFTFWGYTEAACPPAPWIPYRDQKCIKILDDFVDITSAEQACKMEIPIGSNYPSTLLSIKTPREQAYFQELIFVEFGVIDNVWLAARQEGFNESFIWPDGTTLEETYANWAPGNPIIDEERSCIEMRSNYSKRADALSEGQWFNVPCNKRSLVICENLPFVTMQELKIQLNEAIRRIEALELIISAGRKVQKGIFSWFGF